MRTRYVDVSLYTHTHIRRGFAMSFSPIELLPISVPPLPAFLFRHILLSRDALAPAFTSANTFAASTPRREKSRRADSQGHTSRPDEKSAGVSK